MSRFWLSWTEASPDYRPITSPPGPEILGWWCSGEAADGRHTLCALVEAKSEAAAQAVIAEDWPGDHREWRFCTVVDADWLPGDRFPLSMEWMRQRVDRSRLARGAR